MPANAEQVLPVVRVSQIAEDEIAERWLVEELWVRLCGRRDRRAAPPSVPRRGWGWTWP